MINILLKDKNGVEVSNGDILKIVSIKKEFQEEFDPYFKFNVGVNIDWQEITINPQQDLDNLGYCGIDNYEYFTKKTLLETFDLPPNCTDEEYKEYVYDEICKNLKINPKDEDDFFKIINGFEIIYPQVSEWENKNFV